MHNVISDTPIRHFLAVLREKVYRNRDFIPLHEPCLRDSEVQRVKNCVESGWVSTVGNYVNDFEEGIKNFTKSKYVIATSSGTASLHLALLGVGVKANDEVLLPALTFVATANAISYTGAIPHFVDCDNTSLGVDPVCLEKYLK